MNLKKFTKKKLEEIGRKYGIELDRRYRKDTLIDQLEDVLEEVDQLEELVEEVDHVVQEVYLTDITKPAKSRSHHFVDSDGNVLKFKDERSATISGKKYGGRAMKKDNYYIVVKR